MIKRIRLKRAKIKEKSYFFFILKIINVKLMNYFINESLIKKHNIKNCKLFNKICKII